MKNYKNDYISIRHYMKLSDFCEYIEVTDLVSNKTAVIKEKRFKEYVLYKEELNSFSTEAIENELSLKEQYPGEFYNLTIALYSKDELRNELERRKSKEPQPIFANEIDAINAAMKSLGYPTIQTVKKKGWKPKDKKER